MKYKKNWVTAVIIIILIVLLVRTLTQENDWICVNGEWVEHGVPNALKPEGYCVDGKVDNFKECLAAGNPAMESYPRQCMHEDQTFTEIINEDEDGIILMKNKNTGVYGCFGCNNEFCVDPSSAMEQVEETSERYCSPDFEVIEKQRNYCTPESREADACIEISQPVCGFVQVQCVTTPCFPVEETFTNSCFACQDENVLYYVEGVCQ